jgi:hypothetical protein
VTLLLIISLSIVVLQTALDLRFLPKPPAHVRIADVIVTRPPNATAGHVFELHRLFV